MIFECLRRKDKHNKSNCDEYTLSTHREGVFRTKQISDTILYFQVHKLDEAIVYYLCHNMVYEEDIYSIA